MTQQAERRRDRTSFQELAKMAQTPPPPSMSEQVSSKSGPLSTPAASNPLIWPSTPNLAGPPSTSGPWAGAESDSGMVDLKAISDADPATVAARERAKATALASEGLFEDAPAAASSSAPPPSLASGDRSTMPSVGGQPTSHAAVAAHAASAAISAAPAVSAVSSVASAPSMAQPTAQRKKKGGAVIGLVAAFGALAAGAFFFVSQKAPPAPVAITAPAEVKLPVAPAAPPVVAAPAPVVEGAPVAQAEPVGTEPVAGKAGRRSTKAGAGAGKVAAADGPKVAAPAEPVAAKEAKPVGPFTGGSLKDEMEKRSGGEKGAAPEVADDSKNAARGTQPKPSQGQVTGAIGAVLMKARECLGPDDPVSKANVVFASSGAVQSVSVSGGAAGKPAEACVKAALGKAKVPAFADATYSFPVTVRPL